jgi:hypothetical protein
MTIGDEQMVYTRYARKRAEVGTVEMLLTPRAGSDGRSTYAPPATRARGTSARPTPKRRRLEPPEPEDPEPEPEPGPVLEPGVIVCASAGALAADAVRVVRRPAVDDTLRAKTDECRRAVTGVDSRDTERVWGACATRKRRRDARTNVIRLFSGWD